MELQEAIKRARHLAKVSECGVYEYPDNKEMFLKDRDALFLVADELEKLQKENELAKQQLIKNCNIADDKNQLLAENEELKEIIANKDECLKNIIGLGFDYDGFYNSETKQGNIEDMASLIDDIVKIAKDGLRGGD